MKTTLNKLINSITPKKALIFTVLFLLMLWLIDYSPIGVASLLKVSNGVSILDYETRYTADFAYSHLEAMGEAGRAFHLTKVMPLDIIYPPCLMLFMFGIVALLLKYCTKDNSAARFVAILPPIYLLLDWIENIGITAMLINFPSRLDTIAVMTGIVTSVKKTVVLGVIISVLVLIISAVVIKIRKK